MRYRTKLRVGFLATSLGVNILSHSGDAIVGNIGSESRMEYTAIGDTVNTAARLESATKEFGVDMLISESTHEAVGGRFETSSIGPVYVKGRAAPVMTYSVLVS